MKCTPLSRVLRTLFVLFVICVLLQSISHTAIQAQNSDQTQPPATFKPPLMLAVGDPWVIRQRPNTPLPEHFTGMSQTSSWPYLMPAAIYRYQDAKIAFVCIGTVFRTGTNESKIIFPDHMIRDDIYTQVKYAVRLARPDSKILFGFIQNIEQCSTNFGGKDIAIGSIGPSPVPIEHLRPIKGVDDDGGTFEESSAAFFKNVGSTNITSLITGQRAPILGMAIVLNSPKHGIQTRETNVWIELPSTEGMSGSAFIDEYQRIFFLQGKLNPEKPQTRKILETFAKKYGRTVTNISVLTAPISIERQ
jgi:hypothetical protein